MRHLLRQLVGAGCLLESLQAFCLQRTTMCELSQWSMRFIQEESLARSPKLLFIKNYVIEIMTWKFIYTYRERCGTGSAHNRCWNWSPFTTKHTGMHFSKFWNTFPKLSMLTTWISCRIASLSCSIVRSAFLYTLPFNRPQKKRSRHALDRVPLCL